MSRDQIAWNCSRCGQVIADDDGVLQVSVDEANEVMTAARDQDALHPDGLTVEEFLRLPRDIEWEAVHASCDPDERPTWYTIPTAKLRSPWDLLEWTLHLHEKTWAVHTNWDQLMRSKMTPV